MICGVLRIVKVKIPPRQAVIDKGENNVINSQFK